MNYVPYPKWYKLTQKDLIFQTDKDVYFNAPKTELEARLHYIVQYYQYFMQTKSLNVTQGKRYIKILQLWQLEVARHHGCTGIVEEAVRSIE